MIAPRLYDRTVRTPYAMALEPPDTTSGVWHTIVTQPAMSPPLNAVRRCHRAAQETRRRHVVAEELSPRLSSKQKGQLERRLARDRRYQWAERRNLKKGNSLTSRELRELLEWFASLDADGSGEIGLEELADPLLTSGLASTVEEVQQIFDNIDADGSGEVDFEEFCSVMTGRDGDVGLRKLMQTLRNDLQGQGEVLSLVTEVGFERRRFLLDAIMDSVETDRTRREALDDEEAVARELGSTAAHLPLIERKRAMLRCAKHQRDTKLRAFQKLKFQEDAPRDSSVAQRRVLTTIRGARGFRSDPKPRHSVPLSSGRGAAKHNPSRHRRVVVKRGRELLGYVSFAPNMADRARRSRARKRRVRLHERAPTERPRKSRHTKSDSSLLPMLEHRPTTNRKHARFGMRMRTGAVEPRQQHKLAQASTLHSSNLFCKHRLVPCSERVRLNESAAHDGRSAQDSFESFVTRRALQGTVTWAGGHKFGAHQGEMARFNRRLESNLGNVGMVWHGARSNGG